MRERNKNIKKINKLADAFVILLFRYFKKFIHFKRVFLLANIKAQIMRLHFILAVFVLAMVSSSPPFFHASAEDDQCVGFLENCEKNCGEGKLNENKSLCKTWQGGVYKSCVCDGAGFDYESSEEMVRVVFSLFLSGILVRDVPAIVLCESRVTARYSVFFSPLGDARSF